MASRRAAAILIERCALNIVVGTIEQSIDSTRLARIEIIALLNIAVNRRV
jgi:hypothetical protein